MSVNRESLLRVEEANLAAEIARERFESMLGVRDEDEVVGGETMTPAESAMLDASWRQALAFVMMRRAMFETNLGAG